MCIYIVGLAWRSGSIKWTATQRPVEHIRGSYCVKSGDGRVIIRLFLFQPHFLIFP